MKKYQIVGKFSYKLYNRNVYIYTLKSKKGEENI